MVKSTWSNTLVDYSGDIDIIQKIHPENPRRPNSIRDDITTVETVPVELEDGKVIKWWGILSSNSRTLKIWHFNDDDNMSDYISRDGREVGLTPNTHLLYEGTSDENFTDGLNILRQYIRKRTGETEQQPSCLLRRTLLVRGT